jgi:hypothetical protein
MGKRIMPTFLRVVRLTAIALLAFILIPDISHAQSMPPPITVGSPAIKLMADAQTGAAYLVSREPLPAGAEIRQRVVRGPAASMATAAIDCGAIPAGFAAQPAADRPLPGMTVYAAGRVPAEHADVPRLHAERAAHGLETFVDNEPYVEACVTLRGQTVASVRSRLSAALDTHEFRTVIFRSGQFEPLDQIAVSEATIAAIIAGLEPTTISSIDGYGQYCEAKLGPIPWFKPTKNTTGFATYDCTTNTATYTTNQRRGPVMSGGPILPVTLLKTWAFGDGARIPMLVNGAQQNTCDKNSTGYDCINKCDRTEWLDPGSCEPGPTVSSIQNEKGTYFALLCRKVGGAAGQDMHATKTFNDIAMIAFNPTSGGTCFFQNQIGSATDGTKIPDPADPVRSPMFWRSPDAGGCTVCHAVNAYNHSPWIDGAMKPVGKVYVQPATDVGFNTAAKQKAVGSDHANDANPPKEHVVPRLFDRPDIDGFGKYWIVGAKQIGAPPITSSYDLSGTPAAGCVSCHRIASGNFLDFSMRSTGVGANSGQPNGTGNYFSRVTALGRDYAHAHYMGPGTWVKPAWDNQWGNAAVYLQKLQLCEKNPGGCRLAGPLPPKAPPPK